MKRLLLVILLLPLMVEGQKNRNDLNREPVTYSGPNAFHSIVLGKGLLADLYHTAMDPHVIFEVDPNQYDRIIKEVNNGVLTISADDDIKPRSNWKIRIYFNQLKSIKVVDGAKIYLQSNIKSEEAVGLSADYQGKIFYKDDALIQAPDVNITLDHRSSIEVHLATDRLQVNASDVSDLTTQFSRSLDRFWVSLDHDSTLDVKGNTAHSEDLILEVSDHCDIDIRQIIADKVNLNIYGNSKIDVATAEEGTIEMVAKGNSRVNIWGTPIYKKVVLTQGSELINQDR
ncbi:GIN domain-containing protein [Croceivirga thetidis]|uniref:Putative auto-transporter adhesin head GIN domain-containing protein n=1 Tax=Croceivirga thetidis TaxID=2721623 RepID=A0ABX1GNL8_9FLAO|nr:DUF2807 domain-containing protein [Croceivirga thetidis]NKI30636.1 hypothetical protein [Croceivirga thetidis]